MVHVDWHGLTSSLLIPTLMLLLMSMPVPMLMLIPIHPMAHTSTSSSANATANTYTPIPIPIPNTKYQLQTQIPVPANYTCPYQIRNAKTDARYGGALRAQRRIDSAAGGAAIPMGSGGTAPPARVSLGIHQRGVQSEGGAVDGGSII